MACPFEAGIFLVPGGIATEAYRCCQILEQVLCKA